MSSFLRSLSRALAIVFLLISAGAAQARPTHIAASLSVEGPARPGKTIMLAIEMRPEPGWHGYWLNPGDAGLGMTLDWTLPDGFETGKPHYPVPDTLLISGLMNHVYKGAYAVLVPLRVPAGATPGSTAQIALEAQWLACTDEVCVPEIGRMTASVHIDAEGRSDTRFEAWRARLPAPLDAPARFALAGNTLRLAIPLPASAPLDRPHVFIASERVIDYAAPQRLSRNGDTLVIELRRPAMAPASPQRIGGVLRLGASGIGLSFEASPGEVPPAGDPLRTGPSLAPLPLLLAGALLGGLLLNLMPCVFPILSLKALSLARAGESEAQARTEGLAYAAGVIAACLALGALLLGLRAGGEQIGWAFQLQEPLVVAALLLLAVAITANLLGQFELALPGISEGGTARGAFATGVLAAFVATPCTGPFMAAAMGAALLLPTVPALLLFGALGLGLALPFLALAFVPGLRARLPKPGPWMARFRRWMALPMGLTALALLWLASRLGGWGFALACTLFAYCLFALLRAIGQRQRAGQRITYHRWEGRILAIYHRFEALLLVLLAAAILPLTVMQPEASLHSLLPAQPFSEAALAKARASGKPVFVWMTADWCITCKVNESAVIEREATAAVFRKADVVVLRGDWTRRDPAITRYLTAHGAAGIPFYQWFPAGGSEAEQLPQVLTLATLIERAQQATD